MAETYFADTWLFIALLEPRDTHHQRAVRLNRVIPPSAVVTHDAVLTEVLAYFADAGDHPRLLAAQAVRRILTRLIVLPVDRPLFLRALDHYERRLDKEYSLVDCTSMVIMRERGIQHVLTNDHHFEQEGFFLVNE